MKNNKCSTPYCKNDKVKNRTICDKCRMRKYKENHPMEYTYNNLRCNAKRRGKEFKLTFEEFKKFCEENDYMENKGKTANSLSIDRDKNEEGYFLDNMQALTLAENTIKEMNRRQQIKEEFGEIFEDAPF